MTRPDLPQQRYTPHVVIVGGGFVAWLMWVVVHIYFLIGFEDRLLVMIQWAWAYITQQRGNRLITYDRTRPPVVTADLTVSKTIEQQLPDGRWSEKPFHA